MLTDNPRLIVHELTIIFALQRMFIGQSTTLMKELLSFLVRRLKLGNLPSKFR